MFVLQTAEKSIESLTVRVDDLKEQVKEELARNDKMEQVHTLNYTFHNQDN